MSVSQVDENNNERKKNEYFKGYEVFNYIGGNYILLNWYAHLDICLLSCFSEQHFRSWHFFHYQQKV
jgi:hypothetical protein